jgi:hypothetical protein
MKNELPNPALNEDKEIWRKVEGDYYSPSIRVTKGGGIGINVGGYVIVKPVEDWHKLAHSELAPTLSEEELLKMMPPAEGCTRDCDLTIGESCACAKNVEERERKKIARALANKLQKPRKVGRAKILDIITKAYYVDAQNTVEEYFERLADLIMHEGDRR